MIERTSLKPLSIGLRLAFGIMFALLGVILGAVMAFLAAVVFELSPPVRLMLVCSAAYFFCVGAIMGDGAGSFARDALSAVFDGLFFELVSPPSKPEGADGSPGWSAFWIVGVWFFGLLLIAWAW